MTSTSRLIFSLTFCAGLMAPLTSQAQVRATADPLPKRLLVDHPGPTPRSWKMTRQSSDSNPVLVGALVGAGAALGVTAVGAAKYGGNEGGGFCAPCLLQWGAISVPVGAAIGAGIGLGVKRARRSVTATPVITRRSAGVVLFARF